MGFKRWVQSLEWQDWTIILLVLFIIIFGFSVFSKLQHLPSPLYGGDLYSHYGYAENFLTNGLWNDPYYPDELPTYPWFGHLLIILFKFLTGLSLMKAIIYLPIITMSGSLIAYYLLGCQFFKNKTYALVLGMLNLIWWGIVDGHPNLLVWMIEAPLFLLFWLRFEEKGKVSDKILMGVMLGIIALTHIAKFLGVLGAFGFFILVELIRTRKILLIVKKYAPVLIIGAIISLLFYAPIMFKYTEGPKNPVFEYNIQPIETFSPVWIVKDVWHLFFYKPGIMFTIAGIIGLLGLIACILRFKAQKNWILLLFFIGGMIAPMHHYITKPLLNRWVLPYHLNATWIPVLIFIIIGLKEIFSNISARMPKYKNLIYAVLILILILPMASARWTEYNDYKWVQYGRQMDPSTKVWLDFGDWAKDNTESDDVFLSFDETGFAINAVSARKLMIVRRTHANYFVDIDQRIADAAVIFYGNNNDLRKDLLEKYSVDYFLLDPYFTQGILKTRSKYKDYLKENGVKFKVDYDRLDPSIPDAVQFELALIPPQNLSKEFDAMLKPVKTFQINGQNYLVIFEINPAQGLQE